MKIGKDLIAAIWEKLTANILKSKCLLQLMRTNWTLNGTPVPEAPAFYTDANMLGMPGIRQTKMRKEL